MVTPIQTERFVLRELSERDVSERYLTWFTDSQTRRYVVASREMTDLAVLKQYVRDRSGRDDVLFLGIFDRESGLHVGNLKYEPLNKDRGFAVMGILIGDVSYRSKGVAREVLAESGRWLKDELRIREIVLGVERTNAGAIRAYETVGFRIETSPHVHTSPGALTMVWHLGDPG